MPPSRSTRAGGGVHIALLRAVNIGPHGRVAMADMRELLTALGFGDVQSLLASGNLVFRSETLAGPALEQKLEGAVRQQLGVDTDILVRSAKEWNAVVAQNPFPEEAASDPGHLLMLALRDAPAAAAIQALRAAVKGRERVELVGRHLYAVYPDGAGRSKLTNTVIERALRTRSTGRNWNTVLKLAALTGA